MWDIADVNEDVNPGDAGSLKIIQMYLSFIFFWQSCFRISDGGINLILAFFATFLLLLATRLPCDSLKTLVSKMPKTVATENFAV